MTNEERNQKMIAGMIYILTNLAELGFSITGIEYKFISCSSHKTIRSLRGIELKYDSGQMEAQMKGARVKLDTFAYYDNLCFQLKYE